MKTVGVIANCHKARAAAVLERVCSRAGELGLTILADAETSALLGSGTGIDREAVIEQSDVIMALGGDGTMLRAVRELAGRDTPVIGVNIGGLGFLTSVAEEDLDRALHCLAAGDYLESVRAVAECEVLRDGVTIGAYRALNDVVVTRGHSSRVVTLDVSVDGERVTSYVCDGLILSTPTGSTGHSLSAGGPILPPDTRAFVISLICPHTLVSRPMVVSDHSEIRVVPDGSGGPLGVSVDGQVGQALNAGDVVVVRRSERSVRFLHLPGYSYFDVLRQKLRWSGSTL